MAEFIKVAKVNEIPTDTGKLVEVEGCEIALFNLNGEIKAINAVCPHQGGPLHEGGLHGDKVMCPWHGWEFDVNTGKCGVNERFDVDPYKVKVEGDDVLVSVE